MDFDRMNIQFIDASQYNISETTDISGFFMNMTELTGINLEGFNTAHIENFNSLFAGCVRLEDENLDLHLLNTSKAVDMRDMFSECKSLKFLYLSFDMSTVKHIDNMFDGCSSLKVIDMSFVDFSSVTSSKDLFRGCDNLSRIYLYGCNDITIEKVINGYWYNYHKMIEFITDRTEKINKLSLCCHVCGQPSDGELHPIQTGPFCDFISQLAAYPNNEWEHVCYNAIGNEQPGQVIVAQVRYPVCSEVSKYLSVVYGNNNEKYITFRLDEILFQFESIAYVKLYVIQVGTLKDFISKAIVSDYNPNYYCMRDVGPLGLNNPLVRFGNEQESLFMVINSLGGDIIQKYIIYTDNLSIDHLVAVEYSDFHNRRVDYGDLVLGSHSKCPWLNQQT